MNEVKGVPPHSFPGAVIGVLGPVIIELFQVLSAIPSVRVLLSTRYAQAGQHELQLV